MSHCPMFLCSLKRSLLQVNKLNSLEMAINFQNLANKTYLGKQNIFMNMIKFIKVINIFSQPSPRILSQSSGGNIYAAYWYTYSCQTHYSCNCNQALPLIYPQGEYWNALITHCHNDFECWLDTSFNRPNEPINKYRCLTLVVIENQVLIHQLRLIVMKTVTTQVIVKLMATRLRRNMFVIGHAYLKRSVRDFKELVMAHNDEVFSDMSIVILRKTYITAIQILLHISSMGQYSKRWGVTVNYCLRGTGKCPESFYIQWANRCQRIW